MRAARGGCRRVTGRQSGEPAGSVWRRSVRVQRCFQGLCLTKRTRTGPTDDLPWAGGGLARKPPPIGYLQLSTGEDHTQLREAQPAARPGAERCGRPNAVGSRKKGRRPPNEPTPSTTGTGGSCNSRRSSRACRSPRPCSSSCSSGWRVPDTPGRPWWQSAAAGLHGFSRWLAPFCFFDRGVSAR